MLSESLGAERAPGPEEHQSRERREVCFCAVNDLHTSAICFTICDISSLDMTSFSFL